MINILFSWSDIGAAINHAFRILFAWISALIYNAIVYVYDLFEIIARAQFLDNDLVQSIYRKVGLILGLFMLFKLVFSGIQSLIDPNKLTDKKKGYTSIIVRSIVAIVLLGVTPTIFKEAFALQDLLIGSTNSNDNVIYKLIVGKPIDTNDSTFGQTMASELFFTFYTDDEAPHLDEEADPDSGLSLPELKPYENIKDDVKGTNSNKKTDFTRAIGYLNKTSNNSYIIEFNQFFCPIVGGVVLWILIMYCIQAAIRVFQLAYLQLIAPIPILSYISDSEGAFSKWLKQCTTTYLDLFIRLAIIYFIMYFASYILNQLNSADSILTLSLGGVEGFTLGLVKIFLIIGLLLFAKRVPDLLKDLFPNMGGGPAGLSFGLNPKKTWEEIPSFAKGAGSLAAGAAVGGIAGIATGIKYGENARGKIAGGLGGFFRGAASARTKGGVIKNAQKGISNVRAANQRAYERHHDGSTFWGRHGFDNHAKEAFERELELYNDYATAADTVDKELEKDSSVMVANDALDTLRHTGRTKVAMTIGGRTYNAGDRVSQSDMAAAILTAQTQIKTAKQTALQREIQTGSNATIKNALANAEAIRARGAANGYAGFNGNSVNDSSNATNSATSFFANKTGSKTQTNSIKNPGGGRHEEYTRAQANANYRKK